MRMDAARKGKMHESNQSRKSRSYMQNFMNGRNGVDDFSAALGGIGVVLALVGTLFQVRAASYIALVILVLALVRAFSKNISARREENEAFCRLAARIPVIGKYFGGSSHAGSTGRSTGSAKSSAGSSASDLKRQARVAKKMWKERKEKAFLKCPNCGTMLSVPRGKGKIIVTCPKCHARMETKS